MKAVLPAITGSGYEGMEIADGGSASREYLRVTYGESSPAEKKRIRDLLLAYCGLDTLGMVRIVEGLGRIVSAG
jgi:hypothetical protein